MITINSNTRQFNIPGADLVFGVVADSDAERKFFQCPRYVGNNLDLASCFIRINYRNANGKTDFYLVDDMVIDGDNITFSWLLSPKVTEYRGQVKFVMCAVGPDLKLKWHTTQGTGQVMEGLEPDNSHVESQTADVVAQLIAMVEEQTSTIEKVGAEHVVSVRSAAENARTAAVNEIEAKRANSLASIPNDYTALSGTVESLARDRAGGIVCTAEGEVITLNDASNQAFRGLRIFGKSTQDGTPTPENPVEIVSVGSGGNVVADVFGKNVLSSNATSKTLNGVTFNVNTDNSITVNGTASEQTVFALSASDVYLHSDFVLSGCPKGGNEKTYSLVAAYHDAINSVWVSEEYDVGEGLTVAKDVTKKMKVSILIRKGVTVSNLVFYPMLRLATVLDATYEKHTSQSMTIATPNGLPGIPVTSGGNYTDANGQQWVCDEIDFARGVYVQRTKSGNLYEYLEKHCIKLDNTNYSDDVLRFDFGSAFDCKIHTPVLCNRFAFLFAHGVDIETNRAQEGVSSHSTSDFISVFIDKRRLASADLKGFKAYLENNEIIVQCIITNPIETPLSETELAAYRALHTNKPNTTILNDSGAYMSVDYTADTKLYIDNKIKEALQ